ncbi:MAG TPA: PBP1A family penicillin-binding protein [Candidatus Eisenbacteria bacterium]
MRPWWRYRPAWLPAGRARWLLFLLLVLVALLGYDWFRLSSIASFRYAGKGWKFPTRVYADWRDFRVGDRLDDATLRDYLTRARYRRVWARPAEAGQYRIRGATYEIRLRPFTYPDRVEAGDEVVADLADGKLASIAEGFRDPKQRGLLRVEPELLGEFSDAERERRSYIPLEQIPRRVVLAVVASEDRRFFRHWGIDLLGLGRATVRNVRAGGVVEGGSTISQQLVKNLFLSRERSFFRKIHEALLAVMVEMRYSKEQILEFYLNQIYLGQRGSWSVCGVEEASLFYFNKHVKDLTLGEGALIAGIIPAPNHFSPYRDAEEALARRDHVLSDMVDCGWISKAEADRARATPLHFAPSPPPATLAPYFVDYVREYLSKDIAEADLNARGFAVFTTLDAAMEEAAERAVRDGTREADWRSPRGGSERDPAEGALVAIEPATGYVRALVGGRSYVESPYDRALDSRRQPGSAFKPFVYITAIKTATGGRRPPLTPATILEDQPDTFQTNLGPWAPRNFENDYEGQVTMARALARSLNVATVHLEQMVGVDGVIETARLLGIESRLRRVMSLALGTSEVSPFELTRAYAALANGGVLIQPTPVRAVLDRGGNVRWTPRKEARRVLRPETAYMATILLEGPVIYGTAASIRTQWGFTRPAAGKTGTTDDENDAWFVGYTPQLACGVWVGCDRNRRLGLTGTQAAVPIWARFMTAAHRDLPFQDFEAPPGVVETWIDADTGYRAGPDCPHVMRAAFVDKTEPRQVCPVFHMPAWSDSAASDTTDYMKDDLAPPLPPDAEDLPDSSGKGD